MIKTFALALAAVLGATAATAGPIDRRQQQQRHRIREGVRSGELTRLEAARLAREQAAMRAEEAFYRRTGGGLSRWERRELRRELSRARRHIYRQKHDRQHRY